MNDRKTMDQSGINILRKTWSVCPVCRKKIPASLIREKGQPGIRLVKTCPEHGPFSTAVWKDRMDFEEWARWEDPLEEAEHCDAACRSCGGHGQDACCAILEVTKRCDLRCAYCFAHGGESEETPSFTELCQAVDLINEQGQHPLLQLSGGEPTLREDLPELVAYAKKNGSPYVQVNTNGIRLAEEEDYVQRLAGAGLDIVFLQFDGTDDAVYRKLRGRDLLETKLRAVRNCDRFGIGVTLVPTVVRGVNDRELGSIVRMGADLFPAVRSVHFQPVTFLGRHPETDPAQDHYTLDELMDDLCRQTGIPENALLPSRCDHALCEFHSTFLISSSRQLQPMTDRSQDRRRSRTKASRNRAYVADHWRRTKETLTVEPLPPAPEKLVAASREEMDFDTFIQKMKTHTFKISAMAFQDAMNLDLERLCRCSLHVYENGRLLPFCGKYL